MSGRRTYGTGSLSVRVDRNGNESWYGQWRSGGQKITRKLGAKRAPGGREGLTARQAELELRRRMGESVPARPGERLDVPELARRHIARLEAAGRKRSTIVAVRGHVEHWHAPYFGTRSLDSIKPEDVEDLIRLMEKGRRPGGLRRTKPLAPKSIHNAIGTLNAMFRYAQKKRWATTNPVDGVELPAIASSADIRFLEPEEVEAVVAAALPGPYQHIDRALFLTAAMTGLRAGELVALRWRDVDWRAGRVRVRVNYVLGQYGTPKSIRSTRSVPMADDVAGALDRLFKASSRTGDNHLVFADPITGGPLSKKGMLDRFRGALAAAHLDDTHRFHDLRHTFGTRMAAAGVPMRTLQEWMGHKDLATTQRYADYAPAPAHERELVAAAFKSREGIPEGIRSEPQST